MFDCAIRPENHPLLVPADEWARASSEEISLDEVRLGLSGIQGSLSQAIIDARGGR